MDLLVFSHLRWDFVYQRPQHLISRFAKRHRTWFWEEPVFEDRDSAALETTRREDHLQIAVPHLPHGLSDQKVWDTQRRMLDRLCREHGIAAFASWYYNPMATNFTQQLRPLACVYDCMDELSAFRGAPPGLCKAERQLFQCADLVFTGGQSLYESKKNQHAQVFAFPSSIDAAHFQKARERQADPADQADIPHPRIGFAGVLDERLDTELVKQVAELLPEWHLVMLGPVVKISEEDLPKAANLHYLGSKAYIDLPRYLGGWDIGMLPFARNESTRYISPTKTPEYLAAGLPVISTSIRDVVRPYGERGLVEIADEPTVFVTACERLLSRKTEASRLREVDSFLAGNSWDLTWEAMRRLLNEVVERRSATDRTPSGTSAAEALQKA